MKRLGLLAVTAVALHAGSAQEAPRQDPQAPAKPAEQDVLVHETAREPSWRDLKFKPLPTIPIPATTSFTLPNGMRCFLLENHELPIVRGGLLVRTGNLFDPKEKRGLASLTGTTMRSGGTAQLTGDQLDVQLEQVAASIESGIGETSGTAGFSSLKANVDAVMQLFRDVITEPAFRPEKIVLAKTQLKSAISRRNDEPGGIANRELVSLLYGPDTPYGGQEEYDTVDAVTREDIVAFHRRYYFPANVILSVYGDFASADMRSRIERLFGSWHASQPPVPAFPEVQRKPLPGIYFVQKPDVTQTFIEMGELGGELRDADYPALSVAADVFGGGFSSRLLREVRTRLGYAYSISAGWEASYDHPGIFRIGGSTKSLTTTETIEAILAQLERLRTTEISDEELKTAKDTVLNGLVFAFERPSSTLNRLVTYTYFNYPRDFLTRYQEGVRAVSKADVLRVAQRYFRPELLTIVAVGNQAALNKPLTALNLPLKPLDVSIPPEHRQGLQETGANGSGGAKATRSSDRR